MKNVIFSLFALVFFGCGHTPDKTSFSKLNDSKKDETIDREGVRQAVRSKLPKIKQCYEKPSVAKNKPNGKIVIGWEIHAGGIPKNVHIVSEKTTLNDSELYLCMLYEMEQVKFPEPPAGTIAKVVGYPFVFTSK